MATTLIIVVFLLGYVAIAFEDALKINKAAFALITGVLCWTIHITQNGSSGTTTEQLLHHLGDISSILFFLLGAMVIVELIDSHNGFEIIIRRIKTTDKRKLLFIISIITFLISSILNNLTTAIVMSAVCAKILTDKNDRLWFAAIIIIAANAGGVWSPLGDVTTTMLWIGKQVTPLKVIFTLLLPSIAACLIPTWIISLRFKGKKTDPLPIVIHSQVEKQEGRIILWTSLVLLLAVPVFAAITDLPPVMGMLLTLGIMWVVTSFLHKNKDFNNAEKYTVAKALQRVDSTSILFFLGILLAVAAFQSSGILKDLSTFLDRHVQNEYAISTAMGALSAIVDNVPLVAATQGMYDLTTYPTDHFFWQLIALTTGTGGSMIVIGSAAGVAIMGIERIGFMWYLKKISWLALIGFGAGILVFFLQQVIL
ncbi:MAG TPA: sodium:proton antiporter NhaD [Chitinophagaceae bacterium]|nr:sodium:proton antiporter NhaD [Chitinophagaceae bacterium]